MALYAAETSSLTKANKKWLKSFKIWTWRKMLKISCKVKVANASVLEKVKEERCKLNTIWQREHRWLEHKLRNEVLLQKNYCRKNEGQSVLGKKETTCVE